MKVQFISQRSPPSWRGMDLEGEYNHGTDPVDCG